MTIYVSGGCKNGKSGISEDICVRLAGEGPLYYIATMRPFDDEDRDRIERHIRERDGKGFETIEQPENISEILDKSDAANGTFLLDSVTALMINELYHTGHSSEDDMSEMKSDSEAPKRVAEELSLLCQKVKNIVFVSDYIFSDNDNYSEYTVEYMKALSFVDRTVASKCDAVCEVYYGNVEMYKGELPV